MTKRTKTPWPTKAVMEQIYDKHLWGGTDFDFYSGAGSHESNIVNPYLNSVISFLKSFEFPLTVCDLGCGDFNIGQHLTPYSQKYIAVDIVEKLIEHNKKRFHANNLEFYCLDISKDDIPQADCIILRQVLQHLSNSEIQNILKKLTSFKYIILTEHIPLGHFTPNVDIISGQGNRTKHHSGVNILEPPFNFNVKEEECLDQHHLENNKGKIVTTLYSVF
ncbi:class I SAM-dependent methyltransferase [Flavobacteriaceae bacterium GSB9]|nr:class I SAM-dependent methyltransferase [Flavobacteriaceae bacterium GSB9]